MNELTKNTSGHENEALKFLEQDFNQSFQQMRFYDSQVFEILKFIFTVYSVLIGVSVGLYQFGITENKDLSKPAILAIIVGLVFGLFMLVVIVRNRVYFVQVTRYINEQRNFFLSFKPMGFENKCKMYTNYVEPSYFNWRSSQSWLCYIVAFLNSILFSVLLHIIFPDAWKIIVWGFILLIILQLGCTIGYLKLQDSK